MTKRIDNEEVVALPAASNVSINVIQNGSFGYYRSVCLATDHVSYMFNCPDTNRRLLAEQGLRRPPNIKHIFFTHGSWENISGLAGLTAFMKSIDIKDLNLHGPPGLVRILNATRMFNEPVLHSTGQLRYEDHGLDIYEDSNVVIECIPFMASSSVENAVHEYLERRKNGAKEDPPCRSDEMAVAFICKLKPKWGKVIVDKCIQLGIQLGPDIGKLQRGLVVKNKEGREIHPDEVKEPPLPPEYFAVIECPDETFLDSLIRLDTFSKFHSATENMRVVVHFSPKEIMDSVKYQNWMEKFPASTMHWVCNDSTPPIFHSNGVFKHQALLNSVHKDIFPLLWHHGISSSNGATALSDNLKSTEQVVMAEPFTKFCFRPPIGLQTISYSSDEDDLKQKPWRTLKPATAELEQFHKLVSTTKLSDDIYPIITFLGTASASPTKHRNVSGIAMQLEENRSILFDCGESTVSQMQLLYGPEELDGRLVNLKAVFISHLHLDHHGGLYTLILARKQAFQKLGKPYEKLIIVAATPLLRAHEDFSKFVQDTTGLYDFYSTARDEKLTKSMATVASELHLNEVQVVKVIHPQCATGYVLKTRDEKKLVYSGDTRPCDDLVKAGWDADLLIHEATLNDGWEKDALIKKHCTKSEAIAMSRAMNAKWTLLTHFTGLNSKMPYVDETVLEQNPNIGLAHDFMTIQWNHLELVPKITPVLYAMFADYLIDQQGKNSRRRVNLEMDDESVVTNKVARVK